MSPVLGIIASSNQQGRAGGPVGSYDALATVTVPSGGLATVTFAGIPAGYEHLQIRAITRSTVATTQDNTLYRFNGDTSSSYAFHYLYGTGSGNALSGASANASSNLLDGNPGTSIASNIFAASVLDIVDYASTTKFKTSKVLTGWDSNGAGNMAVHSSLWQKTEPVNSITFFCGGSFAQFSQFALYGVK
jgi:hypothetical protein